MRPAVQIIPYPKTNFVFRNLKIANQLMWIFHGQRILFLFWENPGCATAPHRKPSANPSCLMPIPSIVLHKTNNMENKASEQEEMFNRIDRWQKSGLTQKAFCGQINLSYHIFHYWYKRYRMANNHSASSFVKLAVSSPSTASHTELVLPDGRRLLFHQPVSTDYLRALIS